MDRNPVDYHDEPVAGTWRWPDGPGPRQASEPARWGGVPGCECGCRLLALADGTPDLMAFAGPDGQVAHLNAAGRRLLGLGEAGPLEGLHLADFHPPQNLAQLFDRALPAATRVGRWAGDTTLQARDGTLTPVSQVLIAHRGPGGEPAGFSTLVRDLTPVRRLEEQLRQAQRLELLGRLAGGVAHDFNNLLTIIAGYSDLLLYRLGGGQAGDPQARAQVEQIQRAGERAASLTRQLLAFSRRHLLAPTLLDLNAHITNLEKMLRRLLGESFELGLAAGGGLGPVRADPGLLEQLVIRLVVAARDALPEGGRIELVTRSVQCPADPQGDGPVGPWVVVEVALPARGGLSPADVADLEELARHAGGRLEVDARPGGLAGFAVLLPVATPSAELADSLSGLVGPHGGETVLLVEDDADVRRLARVSLEVVGYRVLEAGNSATAQALAARCPGPIDLLLADVILPGLTGPALAERLRLVHPGLRVLFTSGHPDEVMASRAGGLAAGDYLPKPFVPSALLARVRRTLAGARPGKPGLQGDGVGARGGGAADSWDRTGGRPCGL